MSNQIRRRLERLEAKVRKHYPTALDSIERIQEAFRREAVLRGKSSDPGGRSAAEQAEYDHLLARLAPVRKATSRITELVLREHRGTVLTDEEARELEDLKGWCPPDPLLESTKLFASIAQEKGRIQKNEEDVETVDGDGSLSDEEDEKIIEYAFQRFQQDRERVRRP
jgi:hypothetical protein